MQDGLLTRGCDILQCDLENRNGGERTCCLVCIYPAERLGRVIKLGKDDLLIGRDSGCDLELPDDSVSRRHALIRRAASGYTVIDAASKNGTYLNGVRVDARQLEPGDRLRIGGHIFKYLSADRFEAEYFETTYRMMTTDGLTEVYNKRYLFEVAERELRRTKRTGRPLSVLMIDIDAFKSVNDAFGHLTGDEVLVELTRRLRSTLRGDEVLARYGGEEFCLLLPETDMSEALEGGERIRAAVAEQSFPTEHGEVAVTISIGAACDQGASDISAIDLVEQADKQLYAAKRAGRNRVIG